MNLAYEWGVKDLWIVNVGDIKPMELPISFFMDFAWDKDAINAKDLPNYYVKWAKQQFGENYAEEIAGAMLRRQQATAIVAARYKIVEGAVSMVENALEQLGDKNIVEFDEEKKAVMVSNLMVVLCSDKDVTPVVNTGTLHQ